MTHYHQLLTISIAIYWPSTVLSSNNQYKVIIHRNAQLSQFFKTHLMSPAQYTWSSYNLNCQKNENLTSRRASYASNRDKLGSKSSLYQSTSSLHASEQVREAVNYYLEWNWSIWGWGETLKTFTFLTNIQVFFGPKIPCIKDTPITDQFRKVV